MNNDNLLKYLSENELKYDIYYEKVNGVPIWRLIRFSFRVQYLQSKTGLINKTTNTNSNPDIKDLIFFYFKSLISLSKLILSRRKYKNIFFAFPRLTKHEDIYIDKFTDPVIDDLNIKESTLVFQRNLGGRHFTPRYNEKILIYTDFIDISSRLLALMMYPVFFIFYINKVFKVAAKAKKIYNFNIVSSLKLILVIGIFKISYFIYKLIFTRICPKNIFMVNRMVFMPQISVAKKLGIKTYEFQHGITRNETPLYSGKYDNSVDPDGFLAFGNKWLNPFFGIPENKIIVIGWAYTKFLKTKVKEIKLNDKNTFLVASSPEITEQIINFVNQITKHNKGFYFNIRLHPQESLNKEQEMLVKNNKNLSIEDNSKDSSYSILKHRNIIGVNSSVLFEALSMNKNVGIINFLGLQSKNIKEDESFGFYLLNNFEDLNRLIQIKTNNRNLDFYSNFNSNSIKSLIN